MVEEGKTLLNQKLNSGRTKGGNGETLDIRSIFEDQLFYDLFNARCHDTNEKPLCIFFYNHRRNGHEF